MVSPVPVLLPRRLAKATRDLFVGDTAVDSVVYDLRFDVPDVGGSTRYAAVYRAPAGSPGDFVVLGGFADPDVANFALVNRNAVHDIVPVGGHSARAWCKTHGTYADSDADGAS